MNSLQLYIYEKSKGGLSNQLNEPQLIMWIVLNNWIKPDYTHIEWS